MNKGALLFSLLHFIFVCIVANEEGFSTPFTIPVIVILVISSATARRLPHGCPNLSLFGFLCSLLIFIFTLIWAVAILLVPPSVLATCLITAVSIVLCVLVVKGVFSKFKSHEREDWLIKNKTKTGIIGLLIVTILVLAYFFGNLFKTDYESLSLQKLVHLVDQGNVEAKYVLGEKYLRGEGVPKSKTEGRELLFSAAKMGHLEALYSYSDTYKSSDYDFVKWKNIAADNGHGMANYDLAVYYRNTDNKLAYVYANVAAALIPIPNYNDINGGPYLAITPQRLRSDLEEVMSPAEITFAQDASIEKLKKIRDKPNDSLRKEVEDAAPKYFSEEELQAAKQRVKDFRRITFSPEELEAARKRLKDRYKKGRKVADPFQQPAR